VGYQDLGVLNILINNFLDGRHACYLAYSQPANTLLLIDDVGDAGGPFAGAGVLNTAGSIQNSQCIVSWTGAAVSHSGNNLTLTLNIQLTTAFAGNKVIYTAARSVAESNSGWYPLGVAVAPGATQLTTTAVVGMVPSGGTGQAGTTFTFTFSDSKGSSDLGVMDILINKFLDGGSACYIAVVQPANLLVLLNDAGSGQMVQSLASAGSVSNSQCTVSWAANPISGLGNNFSVMLTIGFTQAFSGNRVFYLAARDVNGGNNTDWQASGTWNVQ
jgi:hypothetical protein